MAAALDAKYPTAEFFKTPIGQFCLWTGNNPTKIVNGVWVRKYCVICREPRYPNWDTLDKIHISSDRFQCENENCHEALKTLVLIPGRLYKKDSKEEKSLIDQLYVHLAGHPEGTFNLQ